MMIVEKTASDRMMDTVKTARALRRKIFIQSFRNEETTKIPDAASFISGLFTAADECSLIASPEEWFLGGFSEEGVLRTCQEKHTRGMKNTFSVKLGYSKG